MQGSGSPSRSALLLPAAPWHQETGSAPQSPSRGGELAQAARTGPGCQLSLALGGRLLAFPQGARLQRAGTRPHGTRQEPALPCTGHCLFPAPAAPATLQGHGREATAPGSRSQPACVSQRGDNGLALAVHPAGRVCVHGRACPGAVTRAGRAPLSSDPGTQPRCPHSALPGPGMAQGPLLSSGVTNSTISTLCCSWSKGSQTLLHRAPGSVGLSERV